MGAPLHAILATPFSQRRYGWGDALATKEEVQAAVDDETEAEVLAIMPKAAALVQRGELEHLPTVFEAMRSGLPALADCRRQLLSEAMFAQQVPGPCGACGKVESDACRQGVTKRGTCGAIWCKHLQGILTPQSSLTKRKRTETTTILVQTITG